MWVPGAPEPLPARALRPCQVAVVPAVAQQLSARDSSPSTSGARTVQQGHQAVRLPVVLAGAAAAAAAALALPRPRGRRAAGARALRGGRRRLVASATTAPAATGSSASAGKVVLLGDSVLDNFYWLQTPKRPLRVQLEEALRALGQASSVAGLQCVNLAVDQMTTFDFEERAPDANSWDAFARGRRAVDFEDEQDVEYRVDEDGKIRSAKNLASLEGVEWSILSIGGNDVYLNRGVQMDLLSSLLPPFAGRRQECAKAFGKRIRRVVASVRKAAPGAKLVLVIPYKPHGEFSLLMGAPINDEGARISGDLLGDFVRGLERQYLSDLVTPLVLEILEVAQEEGCPVVDLSKTFDPNNEEHYGTGRIGAVNALGVPWSGAEPSDASTGFTAKLFAHVLQQPEKAVVYRGVPRKEVKEWSILVKQEKNDRIFVEDYAFGPGSKRRRDSSEDGSGALIAFAVGVAVTVLGNVVSILQGGDALFFDRAEFETELQKQLAEERGQALPSDAAAAPANAGAAGVASTLPNAVAPSPSGSSK